MRKNNSIFDSVPNGWCVCGGMIVPKKTIKTNDYDTSKKTVTGVL